MNGPGHPSLYEPRYGELAHNYCLLGATNEELGFFFGVSRRTIDNWIADIPEFAAGVRKGRTLAGGRAARSLYRRAVGCDVTVGRTVLDGGEQRTVREVVHRPPDVRACILWLRSRWPGNRDDRRPNDGACDPVAALAAAGERARWGGAGAETGRP
jgi:hypothetical protein